MVATVHPQSFWSTAGSAFVLTGVAHGGAFGPRWYGTPEVVERWWRG
ncbi:hypothetical protein [Synechococcus sp. CB0205]|nr:hypothetical protein [Synechococcus sp. CB0205]